MQYRATLENLGKKIKKCRVKKNFTQLELAVLCDIEKGHLSRIERGRTNPTLITLFKLAEKLELDFMDLFDGYKPGKCD